MTRENISFFFIDENKRLLVVFVCDVRVHLDAADFAVYP